MPNLSLRHKPILSTVHAPVASSPLNAITAAVRSPRIYWSSGLQWVALSVAAAATIAAGSAQAQTAPQPSQTPQAGQVTPRDLRPETPPGPAIAIPQAAPETAPAGSDKLFVSVSSIVVDDQFAEMSEQVSAALAGLVGRRLAVADFYRFAAQVEAFYQAQGYPLVRVVVPPQQIVDGGEVHLRVLDGFVERVDARAVAAPARTAVEQTLAPLVGRKHLDSATLERALTLAGRVPGVTLKSALGPGEAPGAAVLVLEGTSTPYSFSISGDDRSAHSLGPWSTTVQLRLNQPLGLREQEYVYVSNGPDLTKTSATSARRVAGGGVIVPIGYGGWSINPEATWSSTNPRVPDGVVKTESIFTRYTLRAIKPLILDHQQELDFTATFDATSQTNAAPDFNVLLTYDRVRVGRLGLDWNGPTAIGRLRAYVTGSQGTRSFGARGEASVAANGIGFSRQGMDPSFSKLEFGATLAQDAPLGLQSTLTVRGQLTSGVVPSSELFSLDGEDSLSLFTAGALSDDQGWTAREELAFPRQFQIAGQAVLLSPYLFGAAGHGTSKVGLDYLQGTAKVYGIGLRSNCKAVTFSAEFGHHTRGGMPAGGQAFIKAGVQF